MQGAVGFTGSQGVQGAVGFTGSQGEIGFTGSKGNTSTVFLVAISDEITTLTTGDSKMKFRAPFAMSLTQIPRASLNTASSSGAVTVDINLSGTSILGANKLSIDQTEKTSATAATATTLVTTSIPDDGEISVDIDSAGTNAAGLKITFYYSL